MYCKKCGTYNSNNSLRCKKCGDYFVNQYLNNNINYNNNENNYDNTDIQESKKKNNNKNPKKKNKTKRSKPKIKKISKKHFNKKNSNKKKNKDKNSKEVIIKDSLFSKLLIFFLIIIIILLIIICSGLGLYIIKDKIVKVPDVVELNKDEAINILEKKQIKYSIEYEEVSDNDDVNIVLNQDKEPNQYILKNKIVTITVGSNNSDNLENKTTNSYILKNLIGKSKDEAIEILKNNNINYEIIEIESDEEKGIVIKQNPISGENIDSKSIVTLYISKGNDNNKIIDDFSNDNYNDDETT
jgi:hypothetical protein